MNTSNKRQDRKHANHQQLSLGESHVTSLLVLLSITLVGLSACGGGGSSSNGLQSAALSGNWQFAMTPPGDGSYVGGLQGGFLLQTSGSVSGSAVFSIALPQPPPSSPVVCSSGSAPITGTLSGQNITLTASAGNVTFTLTGTLSSNNSTMSGTYASTAGIGAGGTPCGTAQSGLQWTATAVPPLTGAFQGNFHSTQSGTAFRNQDFAVTGTFTQGQNVGASSASVSGTLIFQNPQTQQNDYPCLTTATVNGEISGNAVTLQIFSSNGLDVGQIGNITTSAPVTYDSTQGGYILHNASGGPGYAVINTKGCPGVSLLNAGDSGNLCLAFGTSTACTQAITLSPFALTFPAQVLRTIPTSQTVTLTNTDPSNTTLNGLSLSFFELDSGEFYTSGGDFNGIANFSEQDSCASPFGSSFNLAPQTSCSITISFSPQQSCPWLPYGSVPFGDAPAKCPGSLEALLTVNGVPSADQDKSFSFPIKGSATSQVVATPPELDYGSEAVGESSPTQLLTFTNQSLSAVQIVSPASAPCTYSQNYAELPRPVLNNGAVSGIQIARTDAQGANVYADAVNHTVQYYCDADPETGLPNFPITWNTCPGAVLLPQESCTLQIAFVPQKGTNQSGVIGDGLDYFLELNTLECDSGVTADCEIDSGRFPVELKTNPPSPLRMSPAAGLNFPSQAKGTSSTPLTITLFNDPNDPNAGTVNFTGKLVTGDYTETDNCPFSMPSGVSCVLSIVFTPRITGSDPGNMTLTYNNQQFQTIYLRGSGH